MVFTWTTAWTQGWEHHMCSPMGSAGSRRVESSISVGSQVRKGCYHTTALSWKELDLGLVKCFSVGLRCFSGNEAQACRCCWYKHVKMHQQFGPHIEEGLVPAGWFGTAAALWARVTWREVSPEFIMSFQWLKGTSAGSDSFFQHCWLELGKTSVEGIWRLQLTQFNCRQNSGVFIENAVSMKISNQTLWLWIKKYLWIKKWNTSSDVEIALYNSSCFWFLFQPPHKRNLDKT